MPVAFELIEYKLTKTLVPTSNIIQEKILLGSKAYSTIEYIEWASYRRTIECIVLDTVLFEYACNGYNVLITKRLFYQIYWLTTILGITS
jgi:hypothetical protein